MAKAEVLRFLLSSPLLVRVAGAYDAMSARLAERHQFQALWASGLSICTSQGWPDAGILTLPELVSVARTMDRVSTLPVIADCDNGYGDVNMVMRTVGECVRSGVAGVCFEDKDSPKRNSFRSGQRMADEGEFSAKIAAAKRIARDDTVVIARVESLVAGTGLHDALSRGKAYCDAGAEALVVHSKQREPTEVIAFGEAWAEAGRAEPLIAIPTTYWSAEYRDLQAAGFGTIVLASQAIRAAHRAVDTAFRSMASATSGASVEDLIAPLNQLFGLSDMDAVEQHDRLFGESTRAQAGKELWNPAAR